MEGHPEEDDDTEDCEERIDTLLDFGCAHLDFFLACYCTIGSDFLLAWIGELLLVDEEDHHGYADHHYGSDEGVVEATAEDFEVLIDEVVQASEGLTTGYLTHEAL